MKIEEGRYEYVYKMSAKSLSGDERRDTVQPQTDFSERAQHGS